MDLINLKGIDINDYKMLAYKISTQTLKNTKWFADKLRQVKLLEMSYSPKKKVFSQIDNVYI